MQIVSLLHEMSKLIFLRKAYFSEKKSINLSSAEVAPSEVKVKQENNLFKSRHN